MAISHLADVSPSAVIGDNVEIGPFTVVYDNVVIGDNSTIQSHCSIGLPTPLASGKPLVIGDNAIVRSHSILYEGSTFGQDLTTGHQVSVREGLIAGDDLHLGTLADVQGDSIIGDHVRIYDGVHIGRKSAIGNFVWIFPYVVLTNDPHPPSDGFLAGAKIEDYAVVATNVTVLPGIVVGSDSLVGAASLVSKDVQPGSFVSGVPAKKIGMAKHVSLRDGSGSAYPWRRHFHRGFPPEVVTRWIEEFKSNGADRPGT